MKTDYIGFYKELTRCFPQIGMILPSSPALARAMARPVDELEKPLSILEAGPGTGPITREILRFMGPEDRLQLSEINPRFLALLKRELQNDPFFIKHKDRVSFIEGPVQSLRTPENVGSFDVIVSSLPFFNFTPQLVDEIFVLFKDLLRPGGTLSFVEYLVTRQIGTLFSSRKHKERVKGVEDVVRRWRRAVNADGTVRTTISLLNVPPALAYQFVFPAESKGKGFDGLRKMRNGNGAFSH